MECKFCGANLEDDAIFCPKCGKSLNEEETPAKEMYNEPDETAETEEIEITMEETQEAEIEADEYSEVVTENAEEDLSSEYEEYEEDQSDLAAIDGYDSETNDVFEDYEPEAVNKKSVIFKIVALIAVLAVVICGGVFAYHNFFATDDTLPIVYTAKENNLYNVYAFKNTMKEPVLLTTSSAALYSRNSDFVMNENTIYYINNDNALFALDFGKSSAVKIADNAQKQGLVMSSTGNELLYTTTAAEGEGYDLYLYSGKSSQKISTIKSVSITSYSVNYGFSHSSDKSIWYTDIQKEDTSANEETLSAEAKASLLNGTLYAKKGNDAPVEIQTGVSKIIYFDIEGQTLVYTTAKPLDVETYSEETLYLKEGENEPTVISKDFYSQPVIAVEKPQKGIVYLSTSEKDTEENKENQEEDYNSSTLFSLMFKPFGGEAVTIDTGATYVYNAERLTSSLYDYYDYSSSKDTGDTLLYIKDQKIYITSNLTAPSEDSVLDFSQSTPPEFSDKMDKVAYLSGDGVLFYRPITNGNLGSAVQIAENVSKFILSDDGSKIAYVVTADEENSSNATVYLYNTKNGQSTEIAQNAYPLVYFSVDQKAIYYINNFDASTQTATLNEYKNGKTTVVMDNISNFVTSEAGVPYILSVAEQSEDEAAQAASSLATIYTFTNPKNLITVDENIAGISGY